MRYCSVCSGIEAATQAWHPLGWKPAFFSEIDRFPRAVLAYRYPDVPLHGDFTTIGANQYGPIDLLVGGTPCQSFSVAGLRGGLDDDRGNLALEYLRLAARKRPRWLVWENVPGVLSSNGGRDFGAILGGMVELGYGFAYRVLDAQHIRTRAFPWAVPQRRRRVFVVGYLGDWRRAAAVLFDAQSLRRDSPPRREAGQNAAPTISARPTGGGGLGTDFDLDGGVISQPVASTLNAAFGSKLGLEDQHINAGAPLSATDGAAPANAVAFDLNQITSKTNRSRPDPAVHHTLPASSTPPHLAEPFTITERGRAGGQSLEYRNDGTSNAILTPNGGRGGMGVGAIAQPWAVRRLTPRECERLQGFPDDFTRIPYRGKEPDKCPDGPRYKALGNSMAVNVMQWLGERIQMVEGIEAAQPMTNTRKAT